MQELQGPLLPMDLDIESPVRINVSLLSWCLDWCHCWCHCDSTGIVNSRRCAGFGLLFGMEMKFEVSELIILSQLDLPQPIAAPDTQIPNLIPISKLYT